MASRNCCKVQAAVGWAVTLHCRMRRLPTSITTNTYSTRKPAVMATRKSAATMAFACWRTNVRHCCEHVLLPPRGSLSCGQYRPHRSWQNQDPELHRQFCCDALFAPARVLPYQAHNQLAKIFRD